MTLLPIHVDIWGGERGLCKVTLKEAPHFSWTEHGKVFPETVLWLQAYQEGKKAVLPPLDLSDISPFTSQVLQALRMIPSGKTISYAEVANSIKNPQGAQAVGRACGSNPLPLFIPCHRVISSNGNMGGYAFGLEIKQQLLAHEKKL